MATGPRSGIAKPGFLSWFCGDFLSLGPYFLVPLVNIFFFVLGFWKANPSVVAALKGPIPCHELLLMFFVRFLGFNLKENPM